MARTTPGEIYEVRVLESFAYIQHIKTVQEIGILARVFTTLHPARPGDLESMISGPSFRIFYPIDAALQKQALIARVGKEPLNSVDAEPLRFRTGNVLFEEGKERQRVRVSELSEDEQNWPKFQITSHAFLLKYILEANGIDVSAAALNVSQGESIPSDHTLFFLLFDKKSDAARAGALITSNAACNSFSSFIERSDDKSWLLRLNGKLSVPISEYNKLLESVAESLGGTYDGFEQPVA
jgi:hypothetical protein